MSRHRGQGLAALCVLAASVLWGTTGTAASFAPVVGPLAIGAAAMGLGGVAQALIAAGAVTRQRAALHAQRGIVLLGGAAVAVYRRESEPRIPPWWRRLRPLLGLALCGFNRGGEARRDSRVAGCVPEHCLVEFGLSGRMEAPAQLRSAGHGPDTTRVQIVGTPLRLGQPSGVDLLL